MLAKDGPTADASTPRKAIDGLASVPIRPSSARDLMDASRASVDRPVGSVEFDLAWAIALSAHPTAHPDPLSVVAGHRWWTSTRPSKRVGDALNHLWRHSVAVAIVARRLAVEAGEVDPDRVGRAGLLHRLGIWAMAAIDLESLPRWVAATPAERDVIERHTLGESGASAGRRLATRWGCDPLVIDATWLHDPSAGDLAGLARTPSAIRSIQQGRGLADQTPWALDAPPAGPVRSRIVDPMARILTAEVQARAGGPFIDPAASSREEALMRDNARLMIRCRALESAGERRDGLVAAVANLDSRTNPPENGPTEPADRTDPTLDSAWANWSALTADRDRLSNLLDEAVAAHQCRVSHEERDRRRAALASLAEFAAGAGHELNNPLAVVVGRAQLLLPRSPDAETTRSLRAIIAQAQRAHRILRDLMYVARPPELRPRACQPDEIARHSARDLAEEIEGRGIRLTVDARGPVQSVWADPDALRHLADTLLKNAIQATREGGKILFTCKTDEKLVRWSIRDTGTGMTGAEAVHLFDPFFCGRQAGRGLGLGLPRAARIVEQAGGALDWRSEPGRGTTFLLTFPVDPVPQPGTSVTPASRIPA